MIKNCRSLLRRINPFRSDTNKLINKFHMLYFEKNKIDKSMELLESITPHYLYRYRPVHHKESQTTEFDDLISMIEKKEFPLRFSHPNKFNDPYDSFIAQDMVPQYRQYSEFVEIYPSIMAIYLQMIHDKKDILSEDEKGILFLKAIRTASTTPPEIALRHISNQQIEFWKKEVASYFRNSIDSANKTTSDYISKNMGVLCFSSDKDSLLMWSHYAENHSGYCLEYYSGDIKNLITNYNQVYGLYPVQYADTMKLLEGTYTDYMDQEVVRTEVIKVGKCIDATIGEDSNKEVSVSDVTNMNLGEVLQEYTRSCNVTLLKNNRLIRHFLKRSCQKATSWKYENEWRLVMKMPEESMISEQTFPITPTHIYLGAKTSQKDEDRLIATLKKSGLNIHVTRMQMKTDSMKLIEMQRL